MPKLGLGLDLSAVPSHNALAGSEPETKASRASTGRAAVEGIEDASALSRGHADPIVADGKEPSFGGSPG